ncbi:MAG: lysophospholipid acyltransferase family protein [Planctomycetota bacterium]
MWSTVLKFGLMYAGALFGLVLPRSVQERIVRSGVGLFVRRMAGPRQALEANFRTAWNGALTEEEIRERVRAVFENYAYYLADYMGIPFRAREKTLALIGEVRGAEFVHEAHERGRGLIFVGPHVGNWELAGFLMRGFDCPVHALSIRDPHPSMEKFRAKFREREGIRMIFVGPESNMDGMMKIQAALGKNEAVAMLGDRLYMGKTYTAPFFGRDVKFPAGPLHIAALTGATIVPFVAVREGERYCAVMSEGIEVPDPLPDTVDAAGAKLAASFEAYVRAYPEQWYNFHPVFDDAVVTPYSW